LAVHERKGVTTRVEKNLQRGYNSTRIYEHEGLFSNRRDDDFTQGEKNLYVRARRERKQNGEEGVL